MATEAFRFKEDIELSCLEVLILDCQASGMNPTRDRLLELGWVHINPKKRDLQSFNSYLIQNESENSLSRRVSSITGLHEDDFDSAITCQEAWSRLLQMTERVNKHNGLDICPTVIHYARFENSHLEHLHHIFHNGNAFPLKLICTFEISRRLFPELPRKGIRAVAGYLGYSVEEKRRVANHLKATAFIWKMLLAILETENGVSTLNQLLDWLGAAANRTSTRYIFPMASQLLKDLPQSPGIYKMLRSNGDLLYVGKASSLKPRVKSYFQKHTGHPEHILEMLSQAQSIKYEVTKTALEAALLENEEIKQLSPPYNISLKKSDRQISFFTSDLSESNVRPSQTFCVGPIREPRPLTATFLLREVINGTDEYGFKPYFECLDIPREHAPDYNCFLAGVDLFKEKYVTNSPDGFSQGSLLAIGRLVWKSYLAAKNNSAELTEAESSQDEPSWTPESVLRHIESMLKRAAHQIRRGRFLLLLSESSLLWALRHESAAKRVLLVRNAHIFWTKELHGSHRVPVPPGYRRKLNSRLKAFDLEGYDRMRVLSTEIRRLLSEERPIELRFSRRQALKTAHLRKVFQWL